MINYSIVKRSVNANLIEINQAKSRINQAKKEGKTPQPADLAAILYLTVDCMREQLLEGKKIRLGDLGDFSISLSSKGVEDPNAFNAQNITGVKVIWEPGAEFNLVASRDAQAAVIKAIKQGKDNVDISKPASPSTGGTTEGGGSQTEGGGTGDGE